MAKDTVKVKKEKKHFFKDFKAELKKVIWPTPKQIVNNTVAVVTIVIITAVIVLVLDLAFEALNTYGIDKLRNVVKTNQTVDNTTGDNVVNDAVSEENSNVVEENTTTLTENNSVQE